MARTWPWLLWATIAAGVYLTGTYTSPIVILALVATFALAWHHIER